MHFIFGNRVKVKNYTLREAEGTPVSGEGKEMSRVELTAPCISVEKVKKKES
jgi:hypothetical protein